MTNEELKTAIKKAIRKYQKVIFEGQKSGKEVIEELSNKKDTVSKVVREYFQTVLGFIDDEILENIW